MIVLNLEQMHFVFLNLVNVRRDFIETGENWLLFVFFRIHNRIIYQIKSYKLKDRNTGRYQAEI